MPSSFQFDSAFAVSGAHFSELELYAACATAANDYIAVWLAEYQRRLEKSEALLHDLAAALQPFLTGDARAGTVNAALASVIENHGHAMPLTYARERATKHAAECPTLNALIPCILDQIADLKTEA